MKSKQKKLEEFTQSCINDADRIFIRKKTNGKWQRIALSELTREKQVEWINEVWKRKKEIKNLALYSNLNILLAIIGSLISFYLSIKFYLKEEYTFCSINLIISISFLICFILILTKKIRGSE